MTRTQLLLVCALVIGLSAIVLGKVGDGAWLTKVPESARARANPMKGNPDSVLAGSRLFEQNCSSCHGKQAEGRHRHPNLHSERLRAATPGELEWLITNGSLKNGMPSWSRLPEPQRWQLVSYLKTLE
jgi:mono/diheme cytochrome c family protein